MTKKFKSNDLALSLSNTGESITIGLHQDFMQNWLKGNNRIMAEYVMATRQVVLSQHPKGRKLTHSQGPRWFFGCSSKYVPKWPTHGLIFMDAQVVDDKVVVTLPQELPAAKPRQVKGREHKGRSVTEDRIVRSAMTPVGINVKDEILLPLPKSRNNGSVLLEVKGKTWCFQVPDDELLELAVGLAAKGYATK